MLQYLQIAMRIHKRLSSTGNRKELIQTFLEALKDGKFSPIEWTSLGKALGVFDANEKGRKK